MEATVLTVRRIRKANIVKIVSMGFIDARTGITNALIVNVIRMAL